jgi:hypothetical protein
VLEGDESTFQQQKHDPNKITKLAEEECDQTDLRLVNYTQNNDQMFILKIPADLFDPHRKLSKIQILLFIFDS